MKCLYCGSNLNIDDKFCSFCGKENVHAVQHRKDMDNYRDDYNRTKGVVFEKSGRTVSVIAKVSIMVGLIFLSLLLLIGAANSYRISDWIRKVEIKMNLDTHRANLEKLEADRDFFALTSYFETNELYYSRDLREYRAITYMSSDYLYIYNYTFQLLNQEIYTYTTVEGLIENISDYIKRFYDRLEYNEYEAEQYSEIHMAAMEDVRDEMETFIYVYLHIPIEEIEKLPELSPGKIQLIIERGVGYGENQ